MTSIDINHLIRSSLLDLLPAEADMGNPLSGSGGSFNDYLQRAQSFSVNYGENVANSAEKDSGQAAHQGKIAFCDRIFLRAG